MAQFDVHRNTGRQKQTIPFVVVVQSSLYDHYRRRVVVPLVCKNALTDSAMLHASRINPVFTIDGIEVVLHPLEIVSIALDQLGVKITSLAEAGNLITDALDELLTQVWK